MDDKATSTLRWHSDSFDSITSASSLRPTTKGSVLMTTTFFVISIALTVFFVGIIIYCAFFDKED